MITREIQNRVYKRVFDRTTEPAGNYTLFLKYPFFTATLTVSAFKDMAEYLFNKD